jgi:site-specific recombinase XerD
MPMEVTDLEPDRGLPASPAACPPAALQEALDRASAFALAEKAANTRKAYRSDLAAFRAWCAAHGAAALPASAEFVAAFLSDEANRGIKASTLARRVAAIRYAHRLADFPAPTDDERVRAVVRGIRRALGTGKAPRTPATNDRLLAMVAPHCRTPSALRNRALLLLGFAGAFRRSELVALDVNDVEETTEGVRVTIRRSKTDQEGAGATVAIVRGSVACPVEALKAWLGGAGITEGAIFRRVNKGGKVLPERLTAQSVALIVKAHARRAGLDPGVFAGHSLRSGFLTSAARRGASIFKMMEVSRHRSVDSLRDYVRDADLFRDHAGAGLL